MKYEAIFKADTFEVEASYLYLEPKAGFVCVGTAVIGGQGHSSDLHSGGGHASRGGGSRLHLEFELWLLL